MTKFRSGRLSFALTGLVLAAAAALIGWGFGQWRQHRAAVPVADSVPTEENKLIRAAGFSDLQGADPAPLTVCDAKGTTVKLSDLRGKLVLLHFWGTGCTHCVKEMPALNELAKAHVGHIVILHVCTDEDDPAVAQKMLDRVVPGTTSHSELTGLGLARFETTSLPTVWLIDSAGKAVGRASERQGLAERVHKEIDRSLLAPRGEMR